MRVALVHDWLVSQRGGEHVLVEMAKMFPQAPIYTLVHSPRSVSPILEQHRIITSFIQHLPAAPRRFRQYLPLFPVAVERWDLSQFDLILSTSHCVAKGVRVQPGQRHISYIHTPMRYIWHQMSAYVPPVPGRGLLTAAARIGVQPLRLWDVLSSRRPTTLVANSHHVAGRIEEVWGRRAEVIYPPVDVDFFASAPQMKRTGFLAVSALVPYKRVDLAVRVCTSLHLPLRVVGDGPQLQRLQGLAGPTVRFLGALGANELREQYARAEAMLFCGVEDFGIVMVEALAAGCPVIAFAKGGALEIVSPESGLLFAEQTEAGLRDALGRFEAGQFVPIQLRRRAQLFCRQRFVRSLGDLIHL